MRTTRLAVLLLLAACGGGDSGTNNPPPPPTVATVTVSVTPASIVAGSTGQASAVVTSSSGTILTGKTIAWSSTNLGVATISAAGVVSAVAPGTATVTATVDGVTGGAAVTVPPPPVATVTIAGISRVKVGDAYQYTAQARLADGTVVQRAISWSVPDQTKGTISANGLFTPLQSGPIVIRATVEGVFFDGQLTGYDWTGFGSGAVVGAFVPADVTITNKFGQSEYPDLVIGCSNGTFVLYVDTDNFVTQNGLVGYAFDGGTAFTQTWLEFDLFSALGHPGPTNLATKNFASLIASSRIFSFAFTEFNSTAKATAFRVTGMGPYLNQMLNACPSNAIRATSPTDEMRHEFRALRNPAVMSSERQQRIDRGSQASPAPGMVLSGSAARTMLPRYLP
ncbi:MAG: Ig-like domain-containing protein [Gemmatimonadales bacterium]